MVAYNLQCCNQHEFEIWFKDELSFKQQLTTDLVECPFCHTNDITRLPCAPNIGKKSTQANSQHTGHQHLADIHDETRKMVAHIHDNFDNVGDKFTDEIRKIHHQKSPPRDIYGKAKIEELRDLYEEGIECHIMPDFDKTN
ncbi:MAG: DUF1178 family protein [Alphaproteobacteria bacterium]|nr:DUF1178 family protein [Alphaproteobacteria bacterium]